MMPMLLLIRCEIPQLAIYADLYCESMNASSHMVCFSFFFCNLINFDHHFISFLYHLFLIIIFVIFHCSNRTFKMAVADSMPQWPPDYECDNEMSYIDSFEQSLSSSGEVCF